jgi:hypothetical protein
LRSGAQRQAAETFNNNDALQWFIETVEELNKKSL